MKKIIREVAIFIVIVVGVALSVMLTRLDNDIDRNYRTNLQSRAEDCRLQLGLGITLSENCLSKEMRPYFDRTEKIQTGSMRILCGALHRADPNTKLPEGCPDDA